VKPQKNQVSNEVNEWFTWARAKRIVIAMSRDLAYTPDGEPVSLRADGVTNYAERLMK
jgi:hypothetical protein